MPRTAQRRLFCAGETQTLPSAIYKEWKQAEAAFAKEQTQPTRVPVAQLTKSLADENMVRQKAARLARDAALSASKRR